MHALQFKSEAAIATQLQVANNSAAIGGLFTGGSGVTADRNPAWLV